LARVTETRGRLAGIFEMQGRFDKALALEEDVYAAAVESLGIDHPETRGHKGCLDDLKYRMSQEVLEVSDSSDAKPEVQEMKVLHRKMGHLGRLIGLYARYLRTNFYSVSSVECQKTRKVVDVT
jgi:hypothetical protein